MSDPQNFDFVGSILDALLEKVPLDNAVIRAYRTIPSSGVRPIPTESQKIIDEGDKLKCGGKRKAKSTTSETVKTPKKIVQKPRSPSPVIQEESEEDAN